MANPVVHFEVSGPDGEALAAFYRELFGWKVEPVPGMPYHLIDTMGGAGINGGINVSSEAPPWVTFYVEAEDPQAVLDRAVSLGASVVVPLKEMGPTTVGMFVDPDGLMVGVVKAAPPEARTGQGPSDGPGAPVDWFEILGSDGGTTQRFYGDLFGWRYDPEGSYAQTTAGIGGGVGDGEGQRWVTVYAEVDDPESSLARAEALGGERVYGPRDVGGTVAGAFRDPAGNLFGVYARQG